MMDKNYLELRKKDYAGIKHVKILKDNKMRKVVFS